MQVRSTVTDPDTGMVLGVGGWGFTQAEAVGLNTTATPNTTAPTPTVNLDTLVILGVDLLDVLRP